VENVLNIIESRVGQSGLNLVKVYRKMFTW
jgi:hypothetical protein